MYRQCALVVIGYVFFGLVGPAAVWAQEGASSSVVEALRPEHFAVLPWDQMRAIDGPEDRVHGLASLKDCNFSYAGFPRIQDLPACEKLGLRAIVYPADSLGLTKPQHLSDDQIDKAVRTLAEQTKGSSACVGYYLRDEPGASQFPYLGKIVSAIRRHAPGKLAYINLFPSYASAGEPGKSQLETKSFTEYLERYVAEVKPDFLSYDNYMVEYSQDLRDRRTGASYFRDLLEVRRVSLEHQLPFWNIVTCVQIRPNTTPPSPANLLLQAWTTMAAGARGVSWYKYKEKEYLYCPIDSEHKQTATWSYLQMVNHQLKVIGPLVGRMKSIGVYFTAPAPVDKGPLLPGKLVTKLQADSPLMIGEFATNGEKVDHVMLVNLSLERTSKVQLKELHSLGKLEDYSPQDGHLARCGADIYLPAGQGVLLKLAR